MFEFAWWFLSLLSDQELYFKPDQPNRNTLTIKLNFMISLELFFSLVWEKPEKNPQIFNGV